MGITEHRRASNILGVKHESRLFQHILHPVSGNDGSYLLGSVCYSLSVWIFSPLMSHLFIYFVLRREWQEVLAQLWFLSVSLLLRWSHLWILRGLRVFCLSLPQMLRPCLPKNPCQSHPLVTIQHPQVSHCELVKELIN